MMNNYIVMCQVSGGVTGFRQAPLKNNGSAIQYFATREEAQAEADRLKKYANGPYTTARFHYWVEEAR